MKKTNLFILAATALTAMLGACSEDKLGQGDGSGHPQGGVNFNIGGVETRTSYSNQDWLQIEWVAGDQVKVFCSNTQEPTSPTPTDADWQPKTVATYNVTPVAHTHTVVVEGESHDITTNCKGTLSAAGTGLYWKSDRHTFYAAYGANATMADAASGILKCQYSPSQKLVARNDGSFACMEQAYMVAKTVCEKPTDNVTLEFRPIMTTLEVRVQGQTGDKATAMTLTSMTVTVPKAQDITYHDADGNIFFDYDINNSAVVNAPTADTKAETYVFYFATPQTLAVDGELRITALLPPILIDKDNRVKLAFTSKEAAKDVVTRFPASDTSADKVLVSYKGVTRTPQWVTPADGPGIPADDPEPDTDTSTGNDDELSNSNDQSKYGDNQTNAWQNDLFGAAGSQYDDVLLSSVSLPGANMAGCYLEHLGYLGTSSHRYQSSDLRDLLAQGVRVFDLHPITVKPALESSPHVAESDGGADKDGKYSWARWDYGQSDPTTAVRKYYDVSRVFRDFLDFQDTETSEKPHKNEFLILFIDPLFGMQKTSGIGKYNEDGNLTANAVNDALTKQWGRAAQGGDAGTGYKKIIPCRDDLTIAEARGKMIVIVRGQSGYQLNRSGVTTQPTASGYVATIEKTTNGTVSVPIWPNLYDTSGSRVGTIHYQNHDTSDEASKLAAMQALADESKANHNSASPQNIWYMNNATKNEFKQGTYSMVYSKGKVNNANMTNIVKAADYPIGIVLMDRCGSKLTNGPQLVNAIIELNKRPGVLRTAAGKFYPTE